MADPVNDPLDPNADPPADPPTDPPADPAPEFRAVTSQEEFDARIKERIARERAKFADYSDLKAKADRLAELEAANQTELERAQTEAATEKAEREKLVAEIRTTRLESAILAEAAKPDRNVTDPEAAIDFLTGRDKALLELDDDGSPTNLAKAMDSLLAARPYLVASGGKRGDADLGARQGGANQLSQDDLKKMSSAEIVKAQDEGRLDGLLGVKR